MDISDLAFGIDAPLAASGAQTAPTAGTAIATISAPPAGTYDVGIVTRLDKSGPNEVTGLDFNMEFRMGALVRLNRLKSQAAPGAAYVITDCQLDGSTALTVNATANATASTSYRAAINAVRTS